MLIGGVVDDELGDDPDASPMRLADEPFEVVERAVARMDVLVIRDVVSVVPQRGGIERQQPEAVDAEALKIVERCAGRESRRRRRRCCREMRARA
jgi:hypothetical protein